MIAKKKILPYCDTISPCIFLLVIINGPNCCNGKLKKNPKIMPLSLGGCFLTEKTGEKNTKPLRSPDPFRLRDSCLRQGYHRAAEPSIGRRRHHRRRKRDRRPPSTAERHLEFLSPRPPFSPLFAWRRREIQPAWFVSSVRNCSCRNFVLVSLCCESMQSDPCLAYSPCS